MRFMIMVRANPESEAGTKPGDGVPPEEKDKLIAAMADYHEQLAKAGVLLDAAGLQPSARGWRVHYAKGRRTVVDGPFAETKELIAGYTLIQVRSREEALEWTQRFPAPFGELADGAIEVRQLFELEDFEPSESVDRFRQMELERQR